MMVLYHIDEEREEFVVGDIGNNHFSNLEQRVITPLPVDLIPIVGLVRFAVEGYKKNLNPNLNDVPPLDRRYLFIQQIWAVSSIMGASWYFY